MGEPVAPSVKTIGERLQVKRDRRLAVINPPAECDSLIGLSDRRSEPGTAEVVVLFAASLAEITGQLPAVLLTIRPDAIFWIAYPKLTSPIADDLNRDGLRTTAPSYGLDTVSQIAVDETWSALRFKRVPPLS